jgi:hypothetical protein
MPLSCVALKVFKAGGVRRSLIEYVTILGSDRQEVVRVQLSYSWLLRTLPRISECCGGPENDVQDGEYGCAAWRRGQ